VISGSGPERQKTLERVEAHWLGDVVVHAGLEALFTIAGERVGCWRITNWFTGLSSATSTRARAGVSSSIHVPGTGSATRVALRASTVSMTGGRSEWSRSSHRFGSSQPSSCRPFSGI
jgi:hypothetical protein